eukprot:2101126-Rhodomonas_salina.1
MRSMIGSAYLRGKRRGQDQVWKKEEGGRNGDVLAEAGSEGDDFVLRVSAASTEESTVSSGGWSTLGVAMRGACRDSQRRKEGCHAWSSVGDPSLTLLLINTADDPSEFANCFHLSDDVSKHTGGHARLGWLRRSLSSSHRIACAQASRRGRGSASVSAKHYAVPAQGLEERDAPLPPGTRSGTEIPNHQLTQITQLRRLRQSTCATKR